jgi:hypothetical protein
MGPLRGTKEPRTQTSAEEQAASSMSSMISNSIYHSPLRFQEDFQVERSPSTEQSPPTPACTKRPWSQGVSSPPSDTSTGEGELFPVATKTLEERKKHLDVKKKRCAAAASCSGYNEWPMPKTLAETKNFHFLGSMHPTKQHAISAVMGYNELVQRRSLAQASREDTCVHVCAAGSNCSFRCRVTFRKKQGTAAFVTFRFRSVPFM